MMNTKINGKLNSFIVSDSFDISKKIVVASMLATIVFSLFTQSILLAAALGVSASTAASVANAAYNA